MTTIRLKRLPERKPVKHTIFVTAELDGRLRRYAALYAETYNTQEPVENLIPFMLDQCLSDDPAFRHLSAVPRRLKKIPQEEARS